MKCSLLSMKCFVFFCRISGSRKIGSIDMLYFWHSILSIFNCQTNSVAVLETAFLHPYQQHLNFLEASKLLVSFLYFGVLCKVIVIETLGCYLLLKFQPINLLVDHIQDYYHCKDVKRRFCFITLVNLTPFLVTQKGCLLTQLEGFDALGHSKVYYWLLCNTYHIISQRTKLELVQNSCQI